MKKKIQRWQGEITQDAFIQQQHPILQRIYAARNVTSKADIERDSRYLNSYHDLLNIDKAVEVIATAIREQKHITIVGDYDADGATSTTLAIKALRAFGAKNLDYLVPNRFDFGYGLTPPIVEMASLQGTELIITVDNGISSIEGVSRATELGMRVVVTDHHLAGSQLPAAAAIVNPNQPGDTFPSKNLAGVGVLFYVMLALRRHLDDTGYFAEKNISQPNMASYLDLVALGTVADVVPLDKNNRILVHQGLRRIRAGKCSKGISALLAVGKRQQANVVASDLAFAVGPRLNAAGRLDDMSLGIECLLAHNEEAANRMAAELDSLNLERRSIEVDMQQQAIAHLSTLKLDDKEDSMLGISLYNRNWHQGVVGILASRIKDKWHRPIFAFAKGDDGCLKGSGRSIAGFHIRDALALIDAQHPGLIKKFGGHAMAAGLSIAEKDFIKFQTLFDTVAKDQLTDNQLQQILQSDGELSQEDFSLRLAQLLREAGPWGQHFPEPLFDGQFSIIEQRLVGTNHLKLVLGVEGGSQFVDAIAFNIDPKLWPNTRCEKIKTAYRLDVNEFRGVRNIQLVLEYLEGCEA